MSSRLGAAARLLMAVAGVLLSAAAATARQADTAASTEAIIGDYLVPGYARLSDAAKTLRADLDALCTEPAAARLAGARDSYARVVLAWSHLAHIRFGAVSEESRLERIHFWPDRRGIGRRQVERLIGTGDEDALATLTAQSAAVQGLGALEIVLHGNGADDLATGEVGGFRCRFGLAVADNIGTMVAEIEADWASSTGYGALLRQPGPDNPRYRNGDEVLGEYVGTLANGIEAIREQKLRPVLGETAEAARPRLAIFRRAGLTRAAIAAELDGLRAFFEAAGLERLLPDDMDRFADSALFEFGNAATALADLPPMLGEAAADPERRGGVTYLVIVTDSLQNLVGTRIRGALGLTAGFNSLDGD